MLTPAGVGRIRCNRQPRRQGARRRRAEGPRGRDPEHHPKIWTRAGGGRSAADLDDLMRFNEAIDQAIAESVGRYTRQTKSATDLFIGVLGHDIRNPLGTIVMDGEVTVRMASAPVEVFVSVHNQGPPIPAEDQQRIFEPLERGAHAPRAGQQAAGLGLGLYICREIVRAHGGTLHLESTAEAGTTFSVMLPREGN